MSRVVSSVFTWAHAPTLPCPGCQALRLWVTTSGSDRSWPRRALCERSPLHWECVRSLAQPREINTTITPIPQVRKLRLRKINGLSQGLQTAEARSDPVSD